jgi:hypothetical protein
MKKFYFLVVLLGCNVYGMEESEESSELVALFYYHDFISKRKQSDFPNVSDDVIVAELNVVVSKIIEVIHPEFPLFKMIMIGCFLDSNGLISPFNVKKMFSKSKNLVFKTLYDAIQISKGSFKIHLIDYFSTIFKNDYSCFGEMHTQLSKLRSESIFARFEAEIKPFIERQEQRSLLHVVDRYHACLSSFVQNIDNQIVKDFYVARLIKSYCLISRNVATHKLEVLEKARLFNMPWSQSLEREIQRYVLMPNNVARAIDVDIEADERTDLVMKDLVDGNDEESKKQKDLIDVIIGKIASGNINSAKRFLVFLIDENIGNFSDQFLDNLKYFRFFLESYRDLNNKNKIKSLELRVLCLGSNFEGMLANMPDFYNLAQLSTILMVNALFKYYSIDLLNNVALTKLPESKEKILFIFIKAIEHVVKMRDYDSARGILDYILFNTAFKIFEDQHYKGSYCELLQELKRSEWYENPFSEFQNKAYNSLVRGNLSELLEIAIINIPSNLISYMRSIGYASTVGQFYFERLLDIYKHVYKKLKNYCSYVTSTIIIETIFNIYNLRNQPEEFKQKLLNILNS